MAVREAVIRWLPMRRGSWQTDGRDGDEEGARERMPLTGAPRPLAALGTITSADRCTGQGRKERGENGRRAADGKQERRKERKPQGSERQSAKRNCIFLCEVKVKITQFCIFYFLQVFQRSIFCLKKKHYSKWRWISSCIGGRLCLSTFPDQQRQYFMKIKIYSSAS